MIIQNYAYSILVNDNLTLAQAISIAINNDLTVSGHDEGGLNVSLFSMGHDHDSLEFRAETPAEFRVILAMVNEIAKEAKAS